MNKLIKFQYNKKTYLVNRLDTLKDLLNRTDLLKELPLSAWKELFILKDGICLFECMLDILKEAVKVYDSSDKVNIFTINKINFWLDKSTRLSLQQLANSTTENVSLVLGDEIVSLSPDNLKKLLKQLEIYAGKCYLNTAKHLIAIKKLQTVEDVINYDYTKGYPEKIIFNV